jgi:hypothetical protein
MVRLGSVESCNGGQADPLARSAAGNRMRPLVVFAAAAEPERVTPRIDSAAPCRCGIPAVWDEVHGWLHLATRLPGHRRPAAHVPGPPWSQGDWCSSDDQTRVRLGESDDVAVDR